MAHSQNDIATDLRALGVREGGILMVHASLSSLGQVDGGPATVVSALLEVLTVRGTLVMPAFRNSVSVPGLTDDIPESLTAEARKLTPPYDPATTPSDMGAIAEAFRTWSGALRSAHPTSSIVACGPRAKRITASHPPAWATGAQSPFEQLRELDAQLLLLGVGFNRLAMLHHAETTISQGRRKTRLICIGDDVVPFPDTGDDLDTHFPAIGEALSQRGITRQGRIGDASCHLMSARDAVVVAQEYLTEVLDDPACR